MKLARKRKANSNQDSVKRVFDGDISLNQTSDFAGGCSQYKSVAQQVQIRGITNKFPKQSLELRGTSSLCLENKVTSLKEEENEPSSLTHTSSDAEKTSKCKLCGTDVPEDEQRKHMASCLQQRFGRSSENTKDSVAEDVPMQCELCLIGLNDLDAPSRLNHINKCIDEKIASVAVAEGDQVLDECHLCGKKMPHLSPLFRSLHITRCADKIKTENDQLKAKQAAKNKRQSTVLDCPLCGQKLRTPASRKTHLKKCGQKFDIPPNVVMERVHEQEELHKLHLEADALSGRKPLERQKRPKTRNQNSGGPVSNATHGHSVQFMDDQFQLAMALSRSLHEEQQKVGKVSFETANNLPSTSTTKYTVSSAIPNLQNVNPAKGAFSMLMTPNKPPPVKKRRRKKERDDTMPEMLSISKDELARKIADKMAAMILPQEKDDLPSSTPEMASTELPEKYLAIVPNNAISSVVMSLWSCSSLNDQKQGDGYYVKQLMPPISPCKVQPGSKLKSMASIPGRGLNDSVVSASSKVPIEKTVKKSKVWDKMLNETLVPSSQTAVVLAELANADVTMAPDSDPSAAEASGFLMEDMEDKETKPAAQAKTSLDTLGSDFSCMVNNPLCSDLKIKTRKSTIIHAHKFVLASRCSKLYQEISDADELDLEEFSQDSVLSVLGFLYSGRLDLSRSYLPEVRALAQRWQIVEVTAISDSLKLDLQTEREDALNKSWEDADKTQDHDLNELLKEVWGNDAEEDAEESESSSDDDDEVGESGQLESLDDADDNEVEDDAGQNCSSTEMSPPKKLSQMSDKEIVEILSTDDPFQSSEENDESQVSDSEAENDSVNSDHTISKRKDLSDTSLENVASEDKLCDPEPNDDDEKHSIDDNMPVLDSDASVGEDELESAFIDLRNSDEENSEVETLLSGYEEDCKDEEREQLSVPDQSCGEEDNEKEIVHQSHVSTPSMACRSMEEATPDLFGDSFSGGPKSLPFNSETPVGVTSRKGDSDRHSSFEVVLFDSDEENADELDQTEEYPMQPEKDEREMAAVANHSYNEEDSGCPNSTFYRNLNETLNNSPVFSSQRSPTKRLLQSNLSSKFDSNIDQATDQPLPIDNEQNKLNDLNGSPDGISSTSLSQKRKRVQGYQAASPVAPSSPGPCSSPVFKSRKVCTCTPKKVPFRTLSQEDYVAPIDLTISDGEDERGNNRSSGSEMDASIDEGATKQAAEELKEALTAGGEMLNATSHITDEGSAQVEDIWDDFDDDGGFLGLEIPEEFDTPALAMGQNQRTPLRTALAETSMRTGSSSKISSSTSPIVDNTADNDEVVISSPAEQEAPGRSPDLEEYDPPTDMDTDVSAILNDSAIWDDKNEPLVVNKRPQVNNKLATPRNPKAKRLTTKPAVPSPFTPMPNYDDMKTPNLKDQCKKFGIKQQPKKKMVKSLKHIYNELHQYETDSDLEEGEGQSQQQKISQSSIQPSIPGNFAVDAGRASDSSCDSDEDNHLGKLMETFVDGSSSKDSESEQGSPVKGVGRGRRGEKTKAPSRKKPTKLDTAELKVKLLEFIRADEALNLKILYYEPLLFDEFSATLKHNGIHAKDDVIGQCLDELNIQFTTKSDDGKSKWRRGKKKASPKK